MTQDEKLLRAKFEERNLRGSTDMKVNEGIWRKFKALHGADDFERCYIIAEEMNALERAIMSLDGHVCRLMSRMSEVSGKMDTIEYNLKKKGGDYHRQ